MILFALFVEDPRTGQQMFVHSAPEIHTLNALKASNLEFNKSLKYHIYTYTQHLEIV